MGKDSTASGRRGMRDETDSVEELRLHECERVAYYSS
jgi:hypothetical protein